MKKMQAMIIGQKVSFQVEIPSSGFSAFCEESEIEKTIRDNGYGFYRIMPVQKIEDKMVKIDIDTVDNHTHSICGWVDYTEKKDYDFIGFARRK